MNDLQFLVELGKILGAPGMVLGVIWWVATRQGPDRKNSEIDSLNVKVADHETRIAVMEAIQRERDKK